MVSLRPYSKNLINNTKILDMNTDNRKVETEQCTIPSVICSSRGTKFSKGDKVCSHGDVTTFGYIEQWDEQDGVWVLTTDVKGSFKWWADDEPRLFENCI
jgi:hypothetical protein